MIGVNSDRVESSAARWKIEIDLELREHALEQVGVGNRAGELAVHQLVQVGVERRQIDGDDRAAGAGQPRDQAVADLAAGAR